MTVAKAWPVSPFECGPTADVNGFNLECGSRVLFLAHCSIAYLPERVNRTREGYRAFQNIEVALILLCRDRRDRR
jgi:hypothetical protein